MGPVIFAAVWLLLSGTFSRVAAQAIGVMTWMIFWWITRPVNITVTAILPVALNALLNLVPMETITSQYASDSVILISVPGLITMPWAAIGLDRRIALKTLSLVGPSMKSQITVWLLASTLLSTMLPNVAVCALFTHDCRFHADGGRGTDDIRTARLRSLFCWRWAGASRWEERVLLWEEP